ncbi:MAG: hypothetical protein O7D35_09710 [Acidobacteria bacterium]|nr:hypothetical protein [Acidobacteriota bacterium]
MLCRTTSGLVLAALLVLPGLGHAEEPRGRARTWDIEPTAGVSYLDSGFDAKLMGYRLGRLPAAGTSKIPPTDEDHLETTIPTLGLRVGYNFTRFFALELGGVLGETEVGDGTKFILEENFALPGGSAQRKTQLAQQTATAPGILAAFDTLNFDYTNANMMGVFKFNNRTTSRWVFYGSVGGGYFSLNPDSTPYNECNTQVVFDPTIDPFNDDPNDLFNPDLFEDNPDQLKVVPGCGRAFLTATSVGVITDDTGEQEFDIVLGSFFQDAVPVTLLTPPAIFIDCPAGEVLREDPDTGQVTCDFVPQWVNPPGVLATSGFATTGKVRGVEDFFYSLGAGARWHFKPRHVLRIDIKRHFIETNNKNINEVTFGWSFVLGRGKPDVDAGAAPPPMEPMEDDGVPPPAEDEGAGLS